VRSKEKEAEMLRLLGEGDVFVLLDARRPGVDLPENLKSDLQLILQVGYQMPVPIYDLTVDEFGFSATLSFQRSPYLCRIPWSAVYGLRCGKQAMWWEADAPEQPKAEAATGGQAPAKVTPVTPRSRPNHLKLVN
jgi:hypothetical protein